MRDQVRRERDQRALIAVAVLAMLAAVVAAGYWSTRGQTRATPPSRLEVRADGPALVLGKTSAPVAVEVYEDFGSGPSQQLERQTRGFLRADAAAGRVVVRYRPFPARAAGGTTALDAWGRVLTTGTPRQALAFHDALFDQQPDAAALPTVARGVGVPAAITARFGTPDQAFLDSAQAAAGRQRVTEAPTVLVDGSRLTGSSVDRLVEQLQRRIAGG